MQDKTTSLMDISAQVGLGIHKHKTKVMKVNTASTEPVLLESSPLDEVESFTYLGSTINVQGGRDEDVKTRIGKVRTVFRQLQTICKSRELSQRTKIRIFKSNVKPVLLYGAETWRITKATVTKVETFINSSLRRILKVHWRDKISNISLWERTQRIPGEQAMGKRRWGWIGHTLGKPVASTTGQALSPSSCLGIPRVKGEEVGPETPGAETSWQTPRGWASPGTN